MPERSVIVPVESFGMLRREDLTPAFHLFEYRFAQLTRYIIGRDYKGPALPEGVQEVHSRILAAEDSLTPDGQLVGYAKVGYQTHNPNDKYLGIAFDGKRGVFAQAEPRYTHPDLPSGIDAYHPGFEYLEMNYYPTGSEVDLGKLLGIQERFQCFVPNQ